MNGKILLIFLKRVYVFVNLENIILLNIFLKNAVKLEKTIATHVLYYRLNIPEIKLTYNWKTTQKQFHTDNCK